MGKVFVRVAILALFLSLSCSPASAQSGSNTVRKQVFALTSKYANEKGVLAMSCEEGVKLQTVKMMLRKEFGSDFANAIKAFAIAIYKDAPTDTRNKIVGEIAGITDSLQEIDIKDKMKKGEVARGYIRQSGDKSKITDLLIVVQAPSPKLIYICGEFDTETAQIVR